MIGPAFLRCSWTYSLWCRSDSIVGPIVGGDSFSLMAGVSGGMRVTLGARHPLVPATRLGDRLSTVTQRWYLTKVI